MRIYNLSHLLAGLLLLLAKTSVPIAPDNADRDERFPVKELF